MDRLDIRCNDVLQEVRAVAVVELAKEQEAQAKKRVAAHGLKSMATYSQDNKKVALWIFKYHHLAYVIEKLSKIYYKPYPISVFERWVLCKALGCSERAIEQILSDTDEEDK